MKLKNLIAGVCALCGGAVSAAAETVEYWDPVGKVTNSVEAVVVTAGTTTLTGGWYVVTGEVSRAQINVTGTEARPANLILADGAKLTATDNADYHPGIKVASGAALNVYAQSVDADTMGQLSAKGGYGGAGIGGAGEGGTCGRVNIYGGKLTAVGGEYAAGIGGGGKASKTGGTGGMISIYGGIVTANGENGGAAIGGGNRADGGVISIFGGEVIADNTKGVSEGAGIGGGYAGAGGMILIAGGKVTAVGGYKDNGGAGIGGGEKGSGGTIMITGGIVNATGTDYGAGIGGEGAGGDVTISGGTVVAKAGKSNVWDIGSGDTGGSSGEFVVTGGSVLLANSMKCRDGYPKNGDGTQVYGVMIQGLEGKVTLEGLEGYGTNDIFADTSGNVYLFLPKGDHSFTANGEPRTVTVVEGTRNFVCFWDPVSKIEKTALCVVVDDSTVLEGGNWYVVIGTVERGSVAVNGKANLILADGCELKATGEDYFAGVAVVSGNSLAIYGQTAGTGKLTATGGDHGCAGIGGNAQNKNCGTVIINGGIVTGKGIGGAGIGGGTRGTGGDVTINGGTVTATGGSSGGAGIGGGYSEFGGLSGHGDGGRVTINGGTVSASGGSYGGAGIGGGSYSVGGNVTISGGRLKVAAGNGAALIGAGKEVILHGTVAISGGIFSWKPNDAWIADPETVSFMSNSDSETASDYPWAAVKVGARVTFARPLEHMTAAWTSGDGSVTNAISGTSFAVSKGESGVKVILTPEDRYGLDKTEYVFAEAINEDCTILAEDMPTATYLYAVVTVSQHKHVCASWTSGDGTVTNAISGTSFEVLKGEPFKVLFAPEFNVYELEGPSVYESTGVSGDLSLTDAQIPVARIVPVEYVDADGSVKTCSDYDVMMDVKTEMTNGWYVALGSVVRGSITVNGAANLILMDGCELKATGEDFIAGVAVSPGNSLTIYGQTAGTGKLTATGGRWAAGIGGGDGVAGGMVTINGGMVTATGGWRAAGIGGGDESAGGTVTINGGMVTANGGIYAAGIGGGTDAAGGMVTITNGRLDVKAGESASIIGAGRDGASQGTVEISGGIFSWKPNDEWIVDPSLKFMHNHDATTSKDYPWAVLPCVHVTFARQLAHMTAVWTSEDVSVTNAISGTTSFVVPKGESGVKVIFTPEERYWLDKTEYAFAGSINEDCTIPVEDMPTATYFYAVVTVGQLNHMTAAWTSGDGTVTNAINGTFFEVLKGTTGVKVIFTPEHNYQFVDVNETGVRELDSPLTKDCDVTPPQAEGVLGTVANPWIVGDAVTAYVSDDGTLVIGGTGAMDDFASAADAPWHERTSEVSAVTVADGVTHVGKNVFAGFADTVKVNGIPSSFYRMMGGAYGMSSGQFPSGAISAGFESIEVLDGTAYLGVAVKTNVNLTAEAQDWGKVGLEVKDVAVENGSVIIAVPANTKQGFFYLMSKPAVPSDKGGALRDGAY